MRGAEHSSDDMKLSIWPGLGNPGSAPNFGGREPHAVMSPRTWKRRSRDDIGIKVGLIFPCVWMSLIFHSRWMILHMSMLLCTSSARPLWMT